MRLLYWPLRLFMAHKAKDSGLPATALLVFYLALVLASFMAFRAGSMTAFWDIRNSFSDLWDSVYYACQKSGYTYYRIIYPPLSSLALRLFGTTISGCSEVLGSRGLTLITYGFLSFLILVLSYFSSFRFLLLRFCSSCSGWQAAELCALT